MEHHQINNEVNYLHKKFTSQKRKRDADSILEQHKEQTTPEAPACKRRQTNGFFRPWLDKPQSNEGVATTTASCPKSIPVPVTTYHANMVRQSPTTRQRSPREQQRRDRNTLACLLSRRARKEQDTHLAMQYEQYRAQQAAIMEQQIRFSYYYRHLLQQAVFQQAIPPPGLPPQQQEFLQQMSLSQQLMIFGSRH